MAQKTLAVGQSYAGALISNAPSIATKVVGLVLVAAVAPEEGERLGELASGLKDRILSSAQVSLRYPIGPGGQSATEFGIDPAKLHDVVAADLSAGQAAELAATQRPVSELAFSEPNRRPAWKACLARWWWQPATRRRWPSELERRSPRSRARTSS